MRYNGGQRCHQLYLSKEFYQNNVLITLIETIAMSAAEGVVRLLYDGQIHTPKIRTEYNILYIITVEWFTSICTRTYNGMVW